MSNKASIEFKKSVVDRINIDLLERIGTLQSEFRLYMESAANETKSTSGDKHDTAKSMMQMEQEKLSNQLKQLQEQKKHLELLSKFIVKDKIEFGALVETNFGYFLIAIPVRTFNVDDKDITGITLGSPLGKLMQGLRVGQEFILQDKTYHIVSIF